MKGLFFGFFIGLFLYSAVWAVSSLATKDLTSPKGCMMCHQDEAQDAGDPSPKKTRSG